MGRSQRDGSVLGEMLLKLHEVGKLIQRLEESQTDQRRVLRPAFNVAEQNNGYIIVIVLPGIEKRTLQVELEDGRLLVRAESRRELSPTGEKVLNQVPLGTWEFEIDLYQLSINLDLENPYVYYEDGILEVIFSKNKTAWRRQLSVQFPKVATPATSEPARDGHGLTEDDYRQVYGSQLSRVDDEVIVDVDGDAEMNSVEVGADGSRSPFDAEPIAT